MEGKDRQRNDYSFTALFKFQAATPIVAKDRVEVLTVVVREVLASCCYV